MKTRIVISGEGGQGIQTIAKILSESANNSGFEVSYLPYFGVEQRGTPSIAYLTIDSKPIRFSKFDTADIVVVLQNRAIVAIEKYITTLTNVIFDSSTVSWKDLPKVSINLYGAPATKIATEKFNPKSFNIIIIGAISKLLNIPEKEVWKSVLSVLGKKFKSEEVKESNKDALIFGRELVFEKKDFTKATFKAKHRSIIFKGYDKSGSISPSRCKGCGICVLKCPVGALSFSDELGVYATPIPKVDLEKCIACGNCRNFCPDGAIDIKKDN